MKIYSWPTCFAGGSDLLGSLGMPVGVEGLNKALSGEMKFVGEDLYDPLGKRPGEEGMLKQVICFRAAGRTDMSG